MQFVPASSHGAAGIMQSLYANHTVPSEEPVKQAGHTRFGTVFKVAAAVLLVLSTGWLFRNKILYTRYETAYSTVREIMLPDSSEVMLNAHSSLLVPRWGFTNGDRNVVLNGEAVFKVKHTASNQRFLVKTGG